MSILTKVKEKFKNLSNILGLPRWIGPLITVIAIAVNQALIELGVFSPQAAWLYLPVAFTAANSMRAGLISAALVALYSIWLDPYEIQRTVVVPLSVFALAGLVGLETRALRTALVEARAGVEARRMVDSLNGNITRITEASEQLLDILKKDTLTEKTRGRLRSVLHTLNNLQQATKGWKELAELKKDIGQERSE